MSSRRQSPADPAAPPTDRWVRMLATVDPTAHDRARYSAGTVWCVPAARAAAWCDAGLAEPVSAPAAVAAAAPPPDSDTPPAADSEG